MGNYTTFVAVAAGLEGSLALTYRDGITTLVLETDSDGTSPEAFGTGTMEADGTIVLNLSRPVTALQGIGCSTTRPTIPTIK